MGFVFRNAIGIDEDVIQVNDDNDIDHVCEDVVHELLESCGCISKPFRYTQRNHNGFGMQFSIHLRQQVKLGDMCAGGQFWCKFMLFVVRLGDWK